MKSIQKYLSLYVLIAGITGYFLAGWVGESAWVGSSHPPEFYRLILLLKLIFISALKMMVAPLIFFSLLAGLLNIGQSATATRLGKATVVYYLMTTGIAISIGLFVVFFIHPWEQVGGHNFLLESAAQLKPNAERLIGTQSQSVILVIEKLLKQALSSPVASFASNNIIGVVFFAFLIGMGLLVTMPKKSPIIDGVTHISNGLNRILSWIILFSPIGIFAILFDFQLKTNGAILNQLLGFGAVVLGATAVHGVIVLPALAYFFGAVSPWVLFRNMSRPLLIAFGTSSSLATLPVTMKTGEEKFHLSKEITGFVFPLGATMNMDGTALFEGIAAVFLAYVYGVSLSEVEVFAIFLMAMISSIGAPGMPSGSMSGMQMVMLSVGIPLEAIGLLLIIERPLDTFRTAVNVEGDIVGGLVVQNYLKSRAKLDRE